MSKGSNRRPLSVSQQQFADNWDKAFGSKEPPHGPQGLPDVQKGDRGPMLREVNYDNMWKHSCTVEMGVMWIGKDETCNYCGAWEEDGQ